MDSYIEFESSIIKDLKKSDLIKRFSDTEIKPSPDLQLLIKLFDEPSEVVMEGDELFYLDSNGCPEFRTSISDKGEWLSDKILNVQFDIDQSGNIRKASEAEALFCVTVICQILKEEVFRKEAHSTAKAYDFVNMKPMADETSSFKELLNDWLSLQSEIVSACNYKQHV